jgi:phytoene dehydrogenase-like protein
MHAFEDNAGRTWEVAVTVDSIARVRGLVNVNLVELVEGDLWARLMRDPVLLCDVLYAICKPQADVQGIANDALRSAMAGDALAAATQALLDEIVDFSPSQRDRQRLKKALALMEQTLERARDVLDARLESAELQNQLAQIVATAIDSSGSAPELSACTPAPSP